MRMGGRRERILQVYKKGADHSTSGIQKGDEIREEDFLSELYPLCKEG
jgi:undecaprenyl pyrophosphate synthase